MSEKVKNRLHSLGVNVFLNRRVVKEELETILLKDMELKTKTVIWTAGVAINKLYKETIGLMLSKKGRVLVDKYLRAKSHKNVFILGDGAETTYTGMAQTAVGDGKFAATNIFNSLNDKSLEGYKPKKPVYAIPVGPGWAAVFWKGVKLYGIPGWILRRTADLRFFLSILPPRKAALAFWSKGTLCTECGICTPAYQKLFEA
jgi:NADH dehydrogenase FAD-containing subunit